MILTKRLREWTIKNCDVDVDAEDDVFRKAVGSAIATDELTLDKLKELSTDEKASEATAFDTKLDAVLGSIGKLTDVMSKSMEKDETEEKEDLEEKGGEDGQTKEKMAVCPKCGSKMILDPAKKRYACKDCGYMAPKGFDPSNDDGPPVKKGHMTQLAKTVAGMGFDEHDEDGEYVGINVRVKEAAEMYDGNNGTALVFPSETKSGKKHPMSGLPVKDYANHGKQLHELTEREEAIAGAWGQYMINSNVKRSRTLGFMTLPQHTKELIYYALENEKWGGASDGGDYADIKGRVLGPNEQKALIDDSASGGIEAAPIVFDDRVIQRPLLHGELFPLVNTTPIDRGRRIEGVSTGTVTGNWGGVDDNAIALFNTASYVSAFDTTIFRWEGAVRIGLDFLSDTPIDFGAHFTEQYGERMLEDLDDVIAAGNGTTQPEGIINKSGSTSIAFGGATSIGNYESLRFSVAKNEHRANVRRTAVFCGTETSYQRALAIPVGASDARRLSNTNNMPDYDGYSWMQRPYKINESLTNEQIFYAVLARYRMYRRRGLVMRTSTEGDTLIRNNEMLLVAMARYGGQQERGATVGITTTAPA